MGFNDIFCLDACVYIASSVLPSLILITPVGVLPFASSLRYSIFSGVQSLPVLRVDFVIISPPLMRIILLRGRVSMGKFEGIKTNGLERCLPLTSSSRLQVLRLRVD